MAAGFVDEIDGSGLGVDDLAAVLVDRSRTRPLIVVRSARLSARAHLRLAGALGPVSAHTDAPAGSRRPAVRHERAGDGHTGRWHADQSWSARPDVISLLACVSVGRDPDPTEFLDAVAAARTVPADERRRLADVGAHHHVDRSRAVDGRVSGPPPARSIRRRLRDRTEAEWWGRIVPRSVELFVPRSVGAPGVVHPVLDRAPGLDEPFLRLGDHAWRTDRGEEGAAITEAAALATLLEGAPVYTHRWEPGDLVVYRNGPVLHRRGARTDPAGDGARLLRRVIAAAS